MNKRIRSRVFWFITSLFVVTASFGGMIAFILWGDPVSTFSSGDRTGIAICWVIVLVISLLSTSDSRVFSEY